MVAINDPRCLLQQKQAQTLVLRHHAPYKILSEVCALIVEYAK